MEVAKRRLTTEAPGDVTRPPPPPPPPASPTVFQGLPNEDFGEFYENYETLAALKNWTERQKKAGLSLYTPGPVKLLSCAPQPLTVIRETRGGSGGESTTRRAAAVR
ncbi:hypothetical protein EVAR_25446_1 [Eumeta japonica]|uniref:Uncharacterized protein n=1 Tax=Eumeta variegata TaxID=151549 RepID=A0A4C1VLV2_EUMVA|nr:hypothetical protein EVAR_25446_1 [Eumeta japonica]